MASFEALPRKSYEVPAFKSAGARIQPNQQQRLLVSLIRYDICSRLAFRFILA
jgi:hypothetical protein